MRVKVIVTGTGEERFADVNASTDSVGVVMAKVRATYTPRQAPGPAPPRAPTTREALPARSGVPQTMHAELEAGKAVIFVNSGTRLTEETPVRDLFGASPTIHAVVRDRAAAAPPPRGGEPAAPAPTADELGELVVATCTFERMAASLLLAAWIFRTAAPGMFDTIAMVCLVLLTAVLALVSSRGLTTWPSFLPSRAELAALSRGRVHRE